MITRTQLAIICKTLETKLQELGFVFVDIEFDAVAETLCIVLDNEAHWRLPCLSGRNHENEATIDARLLWNLLRDLGELGVMNPAIRLRRENRDHRQVLGWN